MDDITLSYDEALRQIPRRVGETETAYLYRLTDVVNRAMGHYWRDEGAEMYRLRLPVWDNYVLRLIYNGKMELANPYRALQRGAGFCSQHALIETALLAEQGISADLVHLWGHVVLRAQVDGVWMVADPDYGVVVPFAMSEIEHNPSIIEPYYAGHMNYLNPGYQMSELVRIFDAENNRIYDTPADYLGPLFRLERNTRIAGWIFPLLLVLGSNKFGRREHRGPAETTHQRPNPTGPLN